jgi:hypothetical protein
LDTFPRERLLFELSAQAQVGQRCHPWLGHQNGASTSQLHLLFASLSPVPYHIHINSYAQAASASSSPYSPDVYTSRSCLALVMQDALCAMHEFEMQMCTMRYSMILAQTGRCAR